ncbi:MAG: hypothetical protein E6Q90_11010 [Actinobacteria bacterium]|nr:MAG: hypothetical protein E6Q90_11010 [Actinomycetota bacterium]
MTEVAREEARDDDDVQQPGTHGGPVGFRAAAGLGWPVLSGGGDPAGLPRQQPSSLPPSRANSIDSGSVGLPTGPGLGWPTEQLTEHDEQGRNAEEGSS